MFSDKPDAFMAQFENIADGPLDGYTHAGGFSVSLGKVGDQVSLQTGTMSDITNEMFVLAPSDGLSSSLFVLKPDSSVLEGQLLHDVQILDHLKENK